MAVEKRRVAGCIEGEYIHGRNKRSVKRGVVVLKSMKDVFRNYYEVIVEFNGQQKQITGKIWSVLMT